MNMTQRKDPWSICAVVVSFHPDSTLEESLQEILTQVEALVVVDNTPPRQRQHHIEIPSDGSKKTRLIENPDNLGVATALNQGLEQALDWEYGWLLTLDQDSHCLPNMAETLKRIAQSAQPGTAAIGSNYLDKRNNQVAVTVSVDEPFIERKTIITSGSLINCLFAKKIGGFRDDYFIDQLDHEFCLRVRANGGRVVISRDVVMEHSVGEEGGAWVPLLGNLPKHPPLRKYYVARNSLTTIGKYWLREPMWCLVRALRLLLGLLLIVTLERDRYAKFRAFWLGFADALKGKMGKCDKALQ